jgi:prepilin-type N-terminal cleavage/methylation domain-containing protein
MRKIAFTLVEILVVVVILGILVTVGIPTYRNLVEEQKAKVCQTNLEVLKKSLEIYIMEHDVIPASISQIPSEYLEKAYAQILQKKGAWKIKLAYFILDWQKRGFAYAAFLKDGIAKGDVTLITCPSDNTSPAAGGVSYGINSALAGISSQEYRLMPGGTLLMGDCDSTVFYDPSGLSKPHGHQVFFSVTKYAQGVIKEGDIVKVEESTITASHAENYKQEIKEEKKDLWEKIKDFFKRLF